MDPDDDSPAPPPRVAVAAQDPLARAGLAQRVAAAGALLVVAQVTGLDDLAAAAPVARPDVLLWDLGWNAAAASERLADVTRAGYAAVVLVPEGADLVEVLAAGARAVLPRDTDGATLGAALRAVARGLFALDPVLAAELLPARERPVTRLAEELTARESEVLQLLAAGLSNKALAQRLGISEHTVKFHVNAVLGKLGVQSRTEAVVRAARLGLVIL